MRRRANTSGSGTSSGPVRVVGAPSGHADRASGVGARPSERDALVAIERAIRVCVIRHLRAPVIRVVGRLRFAARG
jgi:hypothetical protein